MHTDELGSGKSLREKKVQIIEIHLPCHSPSQSNFQS